jgi:hypothetical protein
MAVRETTRLGGGLGACLAASFAVCSGALAQAPEVLERREAEAALAPTAATTQVYDQAFFRDANLNNAEDMLRRLPGVAAVLDASANSNNQRGLGAGTEQILIDGKRMASKSTSAAATLRRIPASSVERVELIRGTSDEVQSEGLVVNVVLKEGVALGGVGNFEAVYRFSDMGHSEVDGLVSYANSWGPVAYVLGYERSAWSPLGLVPTQGQNDWSNRFRDERYFYPSGVLSELRPQKWRRVHQKDTFTANASYAFGPGDEALRLNFLYQPNPVKQVDVTALTRFDTAGVETTRATEYHYNKTRLDTVELGGELEKVVGPGTLNVIALHSRKQTDFLDFRTRTEATGAVAELGRSLNDQQTGEDVVQATYALPLVANQTLTLGVEGARNFLNQEIEVFFDLNRDGRLEAIDIPTAEARVQEKRAELSVVHNWRLGSKWTLDSALFYEISRITTNYPAIPIRTLKYFKPRLDLRYNPTEVDRLRFKAERTISQLDFGIFVPSYNVVDTRIDLGNPLVRPLKTWLVELGYERRLAGDNGTLGGRIFYREFDGGINFIPFGFNSAGLPVSARGNTRTSIIWSGEVNAAVRLAFVGLPEAQFNARVLRAHSRVTDVFTGRRRQGAGPVGLEVALGYRHDLSRWKSSYGFNYLDTGGDQLVSDIRNYDFFSRGQRINAFVERALWGSYSIRFDAYSFIVADEKRQRLIYAVSQADGRLVRTERFHELRDRRFALRLRGKF